MVFEYANIHQFLKDVSSFLKQFIAELKKFIAGFKNGLNIDPTKDPEAADPDLAENQEI